MDGTVNSVNKNVLVSVLTILRVTRILEFVTEDVLLDGLVLFVKKVHIIFNHYKKNLSLRHMSSYLFEGVLEILPFNVNIHVLYTCIYTHTNFIKLMQNLCSYMQHG